MSDHECPVGECTARVPRSMLMCRTHWKHVPGDLQRAVYRAYRERGARDGIANHLQACEDAIAAVEGREPEELFA